MFHRLMAVILAALALGAPALASAFPEAHRFHEGARATEFRSHQAAPRPINENAKPPRYSIAAKPIHIVCEHPAESRLHAQRSVSNHLTFGRPGFSDIERWMEDACGKSPDCIQEGMLSMIDPDRGGTSLHAVFSMGHTAAKYHVLAVGKVAKRAVFEKHTQRMTVTGSDGQARRKRVPIHHHSLDEYALSANQIDALHTASLNQQLNRDKAFSDSFHAAISPSKSGDSGGRPSKKHKAAVATLRNAISL